MDAPYEIETDADSILIRLPRALADDAGVSQFLDYLEMQAIRDRSELSAEEADALAAEVKQDAWQRVRLLFEDDDA
jgi:hypothetical protein